MLSLGPGSDSFLPFLLPYPSAHCPLLGLPGLLGSVLPPTAFSGGQGLGASPKPSMLPPVAELSSPSLPLCFHPRLLIVSLSPSQSPHLCVSLSNLGHVCFSLAEFPISLSISVVAQSLSRVPRFATPWTIARQAPLSSRVSRSLLKSVFIELVMLSYHLILCHPLLLYSVCPSIRVFSDESALPLKWPKFLELQLQSFQRVGKVDFL